MMERYVWRILLVDDDQEDYLLIRHILSQSREGQFILERTSSFSLGQAALQADSFDAVLVDYDLGPCTGIDLIREAVAQEYPAPLLLLTGRARYEVDVQAMEAGAADYLCKDEINCAFLERAIRYAIERKKGEQTLRQSQMDLAHAQAVAHTGSWRLDVRLNALLWSDETYRIFDLPLGMPLNYETFLDLVYPEDRAYVERSWAAALHGEGYDIEHRILGGDTIKWVRERAELEFDPQGDLRGGFGTVQDITERKQAEEELREAHERAVWLARFPDENPNPIARVSADGRVLYRNPAAARLESWSFSVGQCLPEALSSLVGQSLAQHRTFDQDIQLGERMYSVSVVPFVQEQYVNLYGRDITKRKAAEDALRESEDRFRVALANPSLAVFSTDCELRYTWFYSTAMGAITAGFIGKRDDEILPQASAAEFMEIKQQALETGVTVQGELQLSYADQTRQFIVSVEPYVDRSGSLKGVIGALFDVTDQRRLEAESFEHLMQLEVHHRLLEYREKERQGIARDLHDGPVQDLSSLFFHLQAFKEASPEIASQAQVAQIETTLKQTVQNLRSMINELRPPALIRFGVSKALHRYTEDFQEKHPEVEINLDLQPSANEAHLPEQVNLTLFRIYQEALNNILKHAQATKIWVRFRQLQEYVILEVQDNGVGLPASGDFCQHIQNHHFGLAGMKERADAVGGEFTLISEPGKGTIIHITIPLVG